MTHQLIIERKVQKDLKKIDKRYTKKIQEVLSLLKINPLKGKQLGGELKEYRSIRAWPYRIIYKINQEKRIVSVYMIAHRQGVYK